MTQKDKALNRLPIANIGRMTGQELINFVANGIPNWDLFIKRQRNTVLFHQIGQ